MKKVDILIPNFDDLGAQKLAIKVANNLNNDHEVSFVVFENKGDFKSLLNKEVKIVELANKKVDFPKIKVFFRILYYLRHVKKNRTDVTISFAPIFNIAAVFSKIVNRQSKVIIQEHCYPSVAVRDRQNMSFLVSLIFRFFVYRLYNFSDIFIVIAESIKKDFVENFGCKAEKIKVIRNPIDVEEIEKMAIEEVSDFIFEKSKLYLIGIGRLVEQKNFSKLLLIFNRVLKETSQVELIILGKGVYEERLKNEARKIGVYDKVHFLGFKLNPFKYLSRADCFCLTSNWEGLPAVIAEAMICKTAVIANDCKAGPEEMIEDGRTGFLIPMDDLKMFSKRINELLTSENLRKDIVDTAYSFAKEEYSPRRFFKTYNELINN